MKSIRGFTYIEILSSLVIFAIIASVGALGLTQMSTGYTIARENSETFQKLQFAMARMTEELVLFNEDSILSDSTSAALHYTYEYQATDGDGDYVMMSDEYTLSFNSSNKTISLIEHKATGNVARLLMEDVQNMQFQFFFNTGSTTNTVTFSTATDGSGNVLPAPPINIIQVTVTMDDSASTQLTTSVSPISWPNFEED